MLNADVPAALRARSDEGFWGFPQQGPGNQTEHAYFYGAYGELLGGRIYFGGRLIGRGGYVGQAILTDRLGSVGGPVKDYPYGQERQTTPQETEKFATYFRDSTGLDYAWNRYYTPTWGRFMQADPYLSPDAVKNPQGWNRYAYVENDPVNFHDPQGLQRYMVTVYGRHIWGYPDDGGLRWGLWWVSWFVDEGPDGGPGGGGSPGDEAGGGLPGNPRRRMLAQRAAVLPVIYGTPDEVFGPEILDCMAGRESDWNPDGVNRHGFRGMYQIGIEAWLDVYMDVPNPPPFEKVAHDVKLSTAFAASYLRILLQRIVGLERYMSGEYGEADLKAAIREYNGSRIAEEYAEQIWECARRLKEGDLEGALRAIGKP